MLDDKEKKNILCTEETDINSALDRTDDDITIPDEAACSPEFLSGCIDSDGENV